MINLPDLYSYYYSYLSAEHNLSFIRPLFDLKSIHKNTSEMCYTILLTWWRHLMDYVDYI